jgi:flagellar biosynthesis protein FliP
MGSLMLFVMVVGWSLVIDTSIATSYGMGAT